MSKLSITSNQIIGILAIGFMMLIAEISAAENGRIVFSGVNDTIMSMNPDGTGTTRLGDTGVGARYSPDGTKIAYYLGEDAATDP